MNRPLDVPSEAKEPSVILLISFFLKNMLRNLIKMRVHYQIFGRIGAETLFNLRERKKRMATLSSRYFGGLFSHMCEIHESSPCLGQTEPWTENGDPPIACPVSKKAMTSSTSSSSPSSSSSSSSPLSLSFARAYRHITTTFCLYRSIIMAITQ